MDNTIKGTKVLTLWEPWATAIALGIKTIETRSWATSYRGKLLIHAATKCNKELLEYWEYRVKKHSIYSEIFAQAGFNQFKDLPLGCIVAEATLERCQEINVHQIDPTNRDWGHYTPDRYGWHLTNVKKLNTPIQAKGSQGLWVYN